MSEKRIYLVVGDTGVGKSAFINSNNINGEIIAAESKGKKSVTQKLQTYELKKFYLIDTKGFNDTETDDNNQILNTFLELYLE